MREKRRTTIIMLAWNLILYNMCDDDRELYMVKSHLQWKLSNKKKLEINMRQKYINSVEEDVFFLNSIKKFVIEKWNFS